MVASASATGAKVRRADYRTDRAARQSSLHVVNPLAQRLRYDDCSRNSGVGGPLFGQSRCTRPGLGTSWERGQGLSCSGRSRHWEAQCPIVQQEKLEPAIAGSETPCG